jgi:hypothetical protein
VSSLPLYFSHDDFASRHLHIQLLRNDYTVPTRCRRRGGIVDPLGCKACRAIRQPISPSNQIQDHSIQNHPKPVSFIGRFIGIGSHASESYYHSYTVATSGVNRLARQICHNRLFRKKLQQNILLMMPTKVSSLAAHNTRAVIHDTCRVRFVTQTNQVAKLTGSIFTVSVRSISMDHRVKKFSIHLWE